MTKYGYKQGYQWVLSKEERDRDNEWGRAKQELEVAIADEQLRQEKMLETLPKRHQPKVIAWAKARDDLVLARARLAAVERHDAQIRLGDAVDPLDTRDEFLYAGARLLRVLRHDPDQGSNLDLLAASIDACSYISPRSWPDVKRAIAEKASKQTKGKRRKRRKKAKEPA